MFVLFKCMECSRLIAWTDNKSDGHRCDCGGILDPIDKGKREDLREKYFVQGDIDFHPRKALFAITYREHDEIMYNLLSERFAQLKATPDTRNEKKYQQIEYLLGLYRRKIEQHDLKR
ncbi:MAG TPA: hypothetical protein DEF42_10345 [Desulfosporosinus sp.]|nr:hypothetical protein [Desulfosporosinus sp.]